MEERMSFYCLNKTDIVRVTWKPRCVLVTIIVVEKQYVLHILSVCL
jgi:hypothetical protein